MRLIAQGFHRNHGSSMLFDLNINDIDWSPDPESYLLISVDSNSHPSAGGAVRSVTVQCKARVRLGGDYNMYLKIDKDEIARLFYLTHKPEIEGLFGVFPWQDKSNDGAA